MKIKSLALILVIAALTSSLFAQSAPAHYTDGYNLVSDLMSDPLNVNVYDGDGSLTDQIDWTGSPRTAVSVCGTFITMLMKHSYNLTDAQYKTKMGSKSPNAALYHDMIVVQRGFARVLALDQMIQGDIMAVKYPSGQNSSGHVMMVQAVSPWQARATSTQKFLLNNAEPNVAGYYDVIVMDSSASYHGSSDSRASKPGGIGRNGVFRVYVDAGFQITGYTWSTVNSSEYKKSTSGYAIAVGRMLPSTW